MDQITLDLDETTHIVIDGVGGDLRLSGWDQNQFLAESSDDRSLHVNQSNGELTMHASADCTVRIPRGAPISVRNIGGDARVKSIEAALTIGRVGGDLSLRQVGDTEVGHVGGDVKAKKVEGFLHLDATGGDAQASGVAGDVVARSVGGDLYLRDIEGGLAVRAGGDVALNVAFQPEHEYGISAGGDLTLRLPPDTSVRIDINAGGDIDVGVPGARVEGQLRQRTVILGSGAVPVRAQAGGDVSVTGLAADPSAMGDFGEQFGDDLGVMAEEFASQMESQINAQIESMMPDFEKLMAERLKDVEHHFEHHFSGSQAEEIASKARRAAEKIEEKARRQADKARRQAETAARHAERQVESARRRAEQAARRQGENAQHMRHAWNFGPRPPMPPAPPVPPRAPLPPMPPAEAVTDEERMVILRMVEQGKISVADAEKLLAALENR